MKHKRNHTESRIIPEGLTAPTPSFTMISHQNAVALLLFFTPPCKRGEKRPILHYKNVTETVHVLHSKPCCSSLAHDAVSHCDPYLNFTVVNQDTDVYAGL
jgi:hypothetical protein